jgi:hypothetical protein
MEQDGQQLYEIWPPETGTRRKCTKQTENSLQIIVKGRNLEKYE